MAAQTNASLPEGLEVGGYRIVKKISSGGFSIVYLATDENGNSVAIKEYMPAALAQRKPGELSPYVSPENLNTYRIGLKCFFEEGRALASIYHPNIVRVINFFRANDTVYMVMNYESGRSLQEHVLRNRNKDQKDVLSERFVRRVFAQVMNGLREVHSNRLLHLDVKPANIYLRMDGTPILLDFGAARQTLQRDISKTYPMYTPGFAAPELYKRDAELGPWTDVYSIGSMHLCLHVRHAAAGVGPAPEGRQDADGAAVVPRPVLEPADLDGRTLPAPELARATADGLCGAEGTPAERAGTSGVFDHGAHGSPLAQPSGPDDAVHEGTQHHVVLRNAQECTPTFARLK